MIGVHADLDKPSQIEFNLRLAKHSHLSSCAKRESAIPLCTRQHLRPMRDGLRKLAAAMRPISDERARQLRLEAEAEAGCPPGFIAAEHAPSDWNQRMTDNEAHWLETLKLVNKAIRNNMFPLTPRGMPLWAETHRGEFYAVDGGILMLAYYRNEEHEWRAHVETYPREGERTAIDQLEPHDTPHAALVHVLEKHRKAYRTDHCRYLREAMGHLE